ncbi:MAG: hypothetical protein KKE11_05055 [Gammaproteobacteria bacterium]|nr:hypothetical protein [Gammaproteobacteria bacterium]
MILKKLVTGPIAAIIICSLTYTAPSYAYNGMSNTGTYVALTISGLGIIGAAIASLVKHDSDATIPPEDVEIKVDDVFFTAPDIAGQQELKITNSYARAVSINEISFNGGAADDLVIVVENNCSSIPANSTCSIILKATSKAYDGSVDIYYDYDNNKKKTAPINVTGTILELYESTTKLDGTIIAAGEGDTKTFTWKNNGLFHWQNRDMTWKVPFEPGGGIVNLNKGTCVKTDENPTIAPGDSCTFTLETQEVELGDYGTLSTTGSNLAVSAYDTNVLLKDGIAVTVNNTSTDYHLGYRSIKIENTTLADTITLDTVTPSSTAANNKIKYCSPTDTSCYYKTDSNCISGGSIAAGTNCEIWFKSQSTNNDLYVTNDLINVYVKTSWAGGASSFDETTYFNAATDQALYAGGTFTSPGNYIAKWNGSAWTSLANGTNRYVYTIMAGKGSSDLYIGGIFTSPGNNVARWNGNSWSAIGTNNINNTVFSFEYDNKGYLYIGGAFSTPGSRIIKCDSNETCSPLKSGGNEITSGTIYSMYFGGGDFIYIGGNFILPADGQSYVMAYDINSSTTVPFYRMSTGAQPTATIFKITKDPSSNAIATGTDFVGSWVTGPGWVKLGGTWNNNIFSIIKVLSKVFIGGSFTTTENHVAKYDGSWLSLSTGTNDSVYSILRYDDLHFYVGGAFTSPGNRIAWWAETNNTWTDVGGSNINGDVRDLTIATSLSLQYDHYIAGTP